MRQLRSCNKVVEDAVSRELFANVNWAVSGSIRWNASEAVDDGLLDRIHPGVSTLVLLAPEASYSVRSIEETVTISVEVETSDPEEHKYDT